MPHAEEVAAPRQGIVRRTACAVADAALAAVTLSLALRFTVRDAVPVLGAVFFATPLVLDAIAAAGAALVAARCGRPRRALLGAALAIASGVLCAHGSFVRNEPHDAGAIRGVFWNVRRGQTGWPRICETLASFRPDVAWLAESGTGADGADEAFAAAFPDHAVVHARGGLTILVRGRAEELAWTTLSHQGRAAVFGVTTRSATFRTVFADVGAGVTPRQEPLRRVKALAGEHGAGPLLVLGDFNTPRDAEEFDAWRGPLAHAFETTGRGYDATWPVPVPVLSLDHVWSGGGLAVRTCELPWTDRSDHLPVVFTFDVP